jgi:hypothetical protein
LIRQPSSSAPRECPTPIILVRTPSLASLFPNIPQTDQSLTDWASSFSLKGYTSIEIDIEPPIQPATSPEAGETQSSPREDILKTMVGVLSSQIRLQANPFPPVIISMDSACLVTQAYVEDNPASGLVLVDPPNEEDSKVRFKYEPRFPILLIGKEGLKESRVGLESEKGVGRGGKGVTVMQKNDRGEGMRNVS